MTKADIYLASGIDSEVYGFGEAVAAELKERFERIDEVAEYNQLKVLNAFREARVSEACLSGTTGYGYNDVGRDKLEEVYALTFHTEAALVRPLIACGTHALAIALFGNLRPGDELLSITGKPYDTLEEVIGIRSSGTAEGESSSGNPGETGSSKFPGNSGEADSCSQSSDNPGEMGNGRLSTADFEEAGSGNRTSANSRAAGNGRLPTADFEEAGSGNRTSANSGAAGSDRRRSRGSLSEYGITYRQVDLLPDGSFDLDGIRAAIRPETHLVAIQRSKGYETRRTLSVAQIGEAIACVKSVRPDIVCMVDNCYGEFVEVTEPSDVGADMIVGSLIKNPGGGLAPSGGYICGTRECVEAASFRMTCPGLGSEIGPSLTLNRSFFQGFFLAPTVTAAALKGAIFAANLYERLGFAVIPDGKEERHDIIQAITLGSPEGVAAFCKGIQQGAPVDSFVTPEPWDMPGYDDQVIMAAGAFVMGSSIELSADGPLRPPYNVYFQGGLTWPSAKAGVLHSLQCMKEAGLIDLATAHIS